MKRNKFILPVTAFALLLSFGLTACGNNGGGEGGGGSQQSQAAQEKITITAAGDKTKLILGEEVQLTASVNGVTWTSSKPDIASVDANGLVKSLAVGSTTIKASKEGYKDGSLTIKVDLENITVTAAGETTLVMEQTLQLTADKEGVTWSSSDEAIATVNNGLVTAVGPGTATISASKEGFNPGKINITVTRPAPLAQLHFEDADHYSADGWWGSDVGGRLPIYTRSSGNASDGQCIAHFGAGDKETLLFTSTGAIQAELVIMMASSSEIADMSAVMTVKLNGAAIDLTGKSFVGGSSSEFAEFSLGTQAIVADNSLELEFKDAEAYPYLDDLMFYSKATATVAIKAAPEREAIELANSTITLNRGETAIISIVKPTDTTGITFTSSEVEMASVDANGKVTGEALGTANIFVKKPGVIGAVVEVTITDQPVEGEIRVEAENQAEGFDWEALGFHMYPDGSYIAFGHSGGAYITGYDVNSEVELAYTVVSEKDQTMTLVIAAAPHYQMQAGEEYVFGVDASIYLNEQEVTPNADAKVIGDGARMGAKTQNITIGDVTIKKGENPFVIKFHGKAPALDCFKFLPKA